MNLLIDLSPIKSGGGAQLALNFIEQLKQHPSFAKKNIIVLLPKSGPLFTPGSELKKHFKLIYSPAGLAKRLIFEYTTLQTLLVANDVSLIFTFFGAGLPHPKNTVSVVGVAYPTICYADSQYWKYLSNKKKFFQKIKNYFRIKRLNKSNLIIAETTVMKKRLLRVLTKGEKDIIVIPPAATEFLSKGNESLSKAGSKTILILSGLDSHKNLWRLYGIINELMKRGYEKKVKFIISVDKVKWMESITARPLDTNIINTFLKFEGSIPPQKIGLVYKQADALMILSDLESFSNNYMEAWKSGVPIISSDRDFARHICGDSALYFEPHDVINTVDLLERIINNKHDEELMFKEGQKKLNSLPTQEEKILKIMKLLGDIIDKQKG